MILERACYVPNAHTVLTRHYAPFVYKLSVTICMNLLLRYIFISNLHPPLASATLANDRKVRTHRNTLYMKSSYLYRPAIHRPSDWLRGGRLVSSCWWCQNCIAFSDRSHSVSSLIISWSFALQNWATTLQATRDGDGQFCHYCFPRMLRSEERGHTNYHYSIISPPYL